MNAHVGKRKKESCLKKGHLVPLATLADPRAVLVPSGGQMEKNAFLQMHLALSRASSCKTKHGPSRRTRSRFFAVASNFSRSSYKKRKKRKNRKKRKSTIDIYNRLNMPYSFFISRIGCSRTARDKISDNMPVPSLSRAYLSKSLAKNGW